MGLGEEVQAITAATARKCKVAVVAGELDKKDAEDLMALAAKGGPPLKHIVTALRNRGFTISDKVLSSHRDGDCACAR